MALIASQFKQADAAHPGINQSMLQEGPFIVEVPDAMANTDTAEVVFPAAGDSKQPPQSIQVCRHTGGDIENTTAAATYAIADGETIEFEMDDDGNGVFEKVTHTLTGLTAEAATAVQIAASINGDAKLKNVVRAVAGLTANKVTLVPYKPRSAIKVIGGTAVGDFAWPGTTADYKKRTYQSQTVGIAAVVGFSWSYNVDTRKLTITNTTGGGVNLLAVFIDK